MNLSTVGYMMIKNEVPNTTVMDMIQMTDEHKQKEH